MPKTPPQLEALVNALPKLSEDALRTVFEKQEVTEAANEQLIACFDTAGIDAAGQASVLEASQFLLRQAAKTAESKRAERLKPMGFSEDHLTILDAVLKAARPPPKPNPASEKQAPAEQQADEPHEETMSAEEIEKLAAEMVGDVREGEDDDDDDDDDDADEDPEPEPDHDDSDPCEVLLKVHSKILGEFLKAALNHLIGHDLSKKDIDSIEAIARDAGVSQRTLRQMLRLTKTLLDQGLKATDQAQITAAQSLRVAKMGGAPGMKVLAAVSASEPPVQEGIPPSKADDEGSAGATKDQGEAILLALEFMGAKKARMFSDTVRQYHKLTAPSEEEDIVEDGVHLRGSLLAEVGDDRDVAARAWQSRWLVVSPGKLEVFYDAASTTTADRICMMPLKFVYIQEPKTVREDRPFAFRIGVKDMKRVEGEAVNKLILDAETEAGKNHWMDTLGRAKYQDAPMEGSMRFEIPHKMKKWTKFEDRWFVADKGRLEMYPNQEAVKSDDYISIIPLCGWGTDDESGSPVLVPTCEILENPKTKRADAPHCFRINVGTGTTPIKVMGKPIGKLVVDAVTLDSKEEWLQALHLCQEIEMPEEIRSRDKKTPNVPDEQQATSRPVSSPIKTIEAAAFDDYGRRRGDPAFGKPLGWMPGDASSGDDSEEESSEEDSSDEESEEERKPRGPPRKLLEAMFEDELVQPSVMKFAKKAQHSQHFHVLHVGWLIVYKCAVVTSDPSSREQVVTRIPLRVCTVAEHLPIGQKGGNEHSFQLNITNPERLKGEKCSKIVFNPSSAKIREQWLDQLALACDSDESDDEYEPDVKAPPGDVARSAKEFDARQIIRVDGQDDKEQEVVVRTTVCGIVVMDGNDKAIILEYIPNSSVLKVEENTITVDEEINKSCQVSVTPSRGMSKKVKKVKLNFVMKDPQRLVDAVKANVQAAPKSDACTDPILISFFNTHPEYNKLWYTSARMERYLGAAEKVDVRKKDERGVTRIVKETMWWAKHVVTINEAEISCFDLDADQHPVSNPTLSIPITTITAVQWPVRPDHLDKRTRICCFSIESEGQEHIFATASKTWARHIVTSIQDLLPSLD